MTRLIVPVGEESEIVKTEAAAEEAETDSADEVIDAAGYNVVHPVQLK